MTRKQRQRQRSILDRWINRPADEAVDDPEVENLMLFLQADLATTPKGQRWLAQSAATLNLQERLGTAG